MNGALVQDRGHGMADSESPEGRVRMIVDTDSAVRNAVRLRHLKRGGKGTLSDIVNEILRRDLAAEIAEVSQYSEDQPAKKAKRKE